MLLATMLILAAASAPPDTPVVTLDEVIVTGTRLPESLASTPAAISVVDRSDYADRRGLSLEDALRSVPGVFVQSRSGAQDVRVTIRGFGARGNGERSNSGNIRGIRVLTDGIPLTEPDGRTSLDLVDLGSADRIEVARSNVSALYGNASGGVVNLRTALDFDAPYVELRERAGSFGYHREQAVSGFTFGNGGRGTVSLANSTFDGWREHSGSTTLQGQLRLAAPLDGRTRLGVFLDAASDLNRYPGPLTRAEADSAPRQANPRFAARDERRRNRIGRAALTLDRALDPAQDLALGFFLEPKVLARSERDRYRDFNRYHAGGSATYQWRREVRPEVESRLSLGGDGAWQDGSILFYTLAPGGGRGDEFRADKREGAGSAGGFVQEEIAWGRASFRVAARYDAFRYLAEDHVEPALDAGRTLTHLTPKAAFSYRHGAHHTLYAALGGGVEVPAFNEIDPPAPYDTLTALNPFLEPTRSTTYEVGARGELAPRRLPGRLRYDLALYWIDVAGDIVPFDGGAYFFTAGRSRRRGIELGLDWMASGRLRIEGAMTLARNRYRVYANDLGDFGGNEMPGLPAAVVTGSARYTLPAGLSGEIAVESVDDTFSDDANTALAPAYTLVDATLAWSRAMRGRALRAYVAVHNLGDRRHIASVFLNGVNGELFEPGLPRNWSAGLTLR